VARLCQDAMGLWQIQDLSKREGADHVKHMEHESKWDLGTELPVRSRAEPLVRMRS